MEQTVVKIGNSLGVTIPSFFVKARKLKAGQKIYVHADPDHDMLFISSTKKGISGITPEYKKWLEEFMNSHADVLKELAKR